MPADSQLRDSNSNVRQNFLLLIAFVSGLAVTGMEISAVRLLAPYVGTSQFVWTNVIGVVLTALAVGYYVGGKVADVRPQLSTLLKLIFSAGVLFIATPWIIQPAFSVVARSLDHSSEGALLLFISSLALFMLLFGFPLVLLGMTSPYLIKLSAQTPARLGEAAGKIFAVSTVGSVIGTFLPTLLLIPYYGTRLTIVIFAALLICVAILGFQKRILTIVSLAMIIIAGIYSGKPNRTGASVIYESETPFHYVRVTEDTDGIRHLYFDNALGFQSVYIPHSILTNGLYYDYFSVLPLLIDKKPQRALIIGLAGGAIARQWNEFYANDVRIDGVEIDKKIFDIANRFFDLKGIPSVTTHVEDGRQYLASSEVQYDIIVVDAYQRQSYIPWTLTTQEFWLLTKKQLTEGGLIAINVIGKPSSSLVRTVANTMASALPHVIAIPIPNQHNTMIMGSLANAWHTSAEVPAQLKNLYDYITRNQQVITHDDSAVLLTDDRAPIEQLTDQSF